MTSTDSSSWRQFAACLPSIVWVNDDFGKITYTNDKWYEFTGLDKSLGVEFGWTTVAHPADAAAFLAQFPSSLKGQTAVQADLRLRRHDGVYRSFVFNMVRYGDNIWVGCAIEIDDRVAVSLRDTTQGDIFDMVVNGTPLPEVLKALCRAAEKHIPEANCSILLIDSKRQIFTQGYSSGLLNPSMKKLEGVSIGPDIGSCGAAGYLRQDVISPDIATDPNWARWAQDITPLGLKSCWSMPVFASDGDVIASFGFYFRNAINRTPEMRRILARLRGLAALAIERVVMRDALRESEEHYRHTVEQIPQTAWTSDANGDVLSFSSRWTELTGLTQEESAGDGWVKALHPDDLESTLRDWREACARGKSYDIYYRVRHLNGNCVWARARANPRYAEDGSVLKWYGTIEDVHDQHVLHEKLRYHAYHDELTGLPNRRKFREDLQSYLLGESKNIGLMLMDLDDFKLINDRYGHQAGDSLLRLFAEHLRNMLEPEEEVFRLGGDEFAIISCTSEDNTSLFERANAIAAELKGKLNQNKKALFCTPSMGCTVGIPNESLDDVFKRADVALYEAKAAGKGEVKLYTSSIRSAAARRSDAFALACLALQNDWIAPHYQPLVDLKTQQIAGYEALLRINHPENGLLMPEDIKYSLGDPRLANSLYERMLQRVVADLAYSVANAIPLRKVAINLSTENLLDPHFAHNILAVLANNCVQPSALKIEITERVFIEKIKQSALSNLKLLRDNGVEISLDDFGTGYASLVHLKSLPVNELKIDRSFVSGLGTEANHGEIVSAMLGLSQMLKLRTVAEGIETKEEADILAQWGCDLGQGYYYGHPLMFREIAGSAIR